MNIIASTYEPNQIFEKKANAMSAFQRGTAAAKSLWLQRRFLHKARAMMKAKDWKQAKNYLHFWALERSYWRYLIKQ